MSETTGRERLLTFKDNGGELTGPEEAFLETGEDHMPFERGMSQDRIRLFGGEWLDFGGLRHIPQIVTFDVPADDGEGVMRYNAVVWETFFGLVECEKLAEAKRLAGAMYEYHQLQVRANQVLGTVARDSFRLLPRKD